MTFPEKDVLYLRDMLRFAKLAVMLTEKVTLDEVRVDQRDVLALERAIEIIGELLCLLESIRHHDDAVALKSVYA